MTTFHNLNLNQWLTQENLSNSNPCQNWPTILCQLYVCLVACASLYGITDSSKHWCSKAGWLKIIQDNTDLLSLWATFYVTCCANLFPQLLTLMIQDSISLHQYPKIARFLKKILQMLDVLGETKLKPGRWSLGPIQDDQPNSTYLHKDL